MEGDIPGAWSYSGGGVRRWGVAIPMRTAETMGGYLVHDMTPDEMVEMAEHLLANARHARPRRAGEGSKREPG